MAVSNKKSSKKTKVKNDFEFDEEEDIDICSLTEGEPILEGTLLRSFIFSDPNSEPIEIHVNSTNAITINNLDYRFSKTNPSGRTPPVDGEAFDMVRCYTLRRSTVRILSKIKAIHQDDNVYLNTIVDEAIRHYYEHLTNISI
jgi:hypothetical protein